jgi:hypothetical protein
VRWTLCAAIMRGGCFQGYTRTLTHSLRAYASVRVLCLCIDFTKLRPGLRLDRYTDVKRMLGGQYTATPLESARRFLSRVDFAKHGSKPLFGAMRRA